MFFMFEEGVSAWIELRGKFSFPKLSEFSQVPKVSYTSIFI